VVFFPFPPLCDSLSTGNDVGSLDFSTDDEEIATRNKNKTGTNFGVDKGSAQPVHGKPITNLKPEKNGGFDFSTDDEEFGRKDQNETGVFESDVLAPMRVESKPLDLLPANLTKNAKTVKKGDLDVSTDDEEMGIPESRSENK